MSLWAFYKLLISSSVSPVAFDISDTGNPKDFMFLAMKEIPFSIPLAMPAAIPWHALRHVLFQIPLLLRPP